MLFRSENPMTDQTQSMLKPDPNSSLFEKLPTDHRRKLNRAIADREPPLLKDVYAEFRLADYQVSRSAFYRYARRRRCIAVIRDLTDSSLSHDAYADVSGLLPQVLVHRLLDALEIGRAHV